MASILVGGYTADMDGNAAGIGRMQEAAYSELLAVAGSPSWLAWHPTRDVLYAALEGSGAVQAFARTADGSLAALGAPVAVGEDVCHVVAGPDALIASCYGDGRVVRVELDAAGRLGAAVAGTDPTDPYPDLAGPAGTGPVGTGPVGTGPADADQTAVAADATPARAPHAHQARFTPAGLISTDLGFDQVRMWDSRASGLTERGRVVLPRGTGPRHTMWHPSGHLFVVTEYSDEIFVLRPGDDRQWRIVAGVELVGTRVGVDFPAEISSSRDGRFIYVGVRGSNTIATVHVRGEGDTLRTLALSESGVNWPRHHLVAGDTLLVAGQLSDEVVALPVDERTGVPGRPGRRVTVPSPTCLLPDRD